MRTLFLEPHHLDDDAVLFASYTLLRLKPQVVTVLGWAQVQEQYGIDAQTREAENAKAFWRLGLTDWRSWLHSDVNPDWDAVKDDMIRYDKTNAPEEVWTPLWEVGAHDQHNAVTDCAFMVFGDRCRFYATYRRGSRRTRTDNEVTPEPDWPARKFKAMSAYASQINLANCRSWFAAEDCLREWVA